MDDAQFYKELAALDLGMAERWKRATGGKLASKIDEKEVDAILLPLFDDNKVTAKEAQALNFLWTWAFAKFTKRAAGNFFGFIEMAYADGYFFRGSANWLVSASELSAFNAAIGSNAGKIDFASPKTGLTYTADYYMAIRRMVADGKIQVFEVDSAGLRGKAGVYRSDIDRLVLYKGLPPALAPWTIIHEVTHAIQDWRDVVSIHKYIEADAYIAAAAAALGVNDATLKAMAEYPAQEPAARLVLDKKAVPSNPDWVKAYNAIVNAVERDPLYASSKDLPFKPGPEEKYGISEKAILYSVMQQMKNASPGAARAP